MMFIGKSLRGSAALALLMPLFLIAASRSAETGDRVLAIDVLLVPDQTMVERAQALNGRLRADYPRGYTLGKAQVPHVTLVQRYVRQRDLPGVYEAVAKVSRRAKPLEWTLRASGIASGPWNGLAITSIGVERTKELDEFQSAIVKTVEPFTVPRGTTAAFSTSSELPKVEPDIVKYVETFVPKASGKHYSPHVTAGAAQADFVDRLKAEPFKKFKFKPAGVAVYQLGSFGTAQKELWHWDDSKQ